MSKVIEEYLKKCNTGNINDLSDEQIEDFFVNEEVGIDMKMAANLALRCVKENIFKKEDVINSMRKSIAEKKAFQCCYLEAESANGYSDIPQKCGWILKP